ncbi:hypothetical protein LCGC14_1929550 [marine sediment metagenome]|uniref:Uncharacterized protein n=1 Tax=marine sediment metagenome TaxID=412755 RepID=A0A0F9IL55_9ZZZZ
MANQYGTKVWAKWASNSLGFALTLLEKPNLPWDERLSHSEAAIKSLNIVKAELEEVNNVIHHKTKAQ